MTVAVVGENLVDVFAGPSGDDHATLGGGPFNVARTCARLGVPTVFFSGLSTDIYGEAMVSTLDDDGVVVAVREPIDLPSARANVTLDGATPRYEFSPAATSAFALDTGEALRAFGARAAELTSLYVGSLGLVVEPMATLVARLVDQVRDDVIVVLDPNCREGVAKGRSEYLERIDRVIARVDVMKLSVEDLAFLEPELHAIQAARRFIDRGSRAVVVTDGPNPVLIVTSDDQRAVAVTPVDVLDTVGAGDALAGGLLAWWSDHGVSRADLTNVEILTGAVVAASVVAASTCTRRGAEPPWRRDLDANSGWAIRGDR